MPEKILIIDDEEATVQLISVLLERRGLRRSRPTAPKKACAKPTVISLTWCCWT